MLTVRLPIYPSTHGEHDYDLAPGFDHHQRSPVIGRESIESITLPIMCLAVYDDQSLRMVAPCSDGNHAVTVHDYLNTIEANEKVVSTSPRDS